MLTKDDIISNKIPLINESIVYFLLNGNDIVYVGQSTLGIQRIVQHINDKKFDSYYFIKVESRLLDIVEECYIRMFQPLYNISKNPKYGKNNKNQRYAYSRSLHIDK